MCKRTPTSQSMSFQTNNKIIYQPMDYERRYRQTAVSLDSCATYLDDANKNQQIRHSLTHSVRKIDTDMSIAYRPVVN